MGIYLNPGSGKFQKAINSEIYVDKTGLIAELNKVLGTEQCCVCISRPRRFGKSMTANMLTAYYNKGYDSSSIFDQYEIASSTDYKKHLNQYNVIAINMQDFTGITDSIKEMILLIQKRIISELKKHFHNITFEDEILSMCLQQIYVETQETFIFIIDECDSIFRENKNDDGGHKLYLDFIRKLLKDQAYVSLAYITGILPIKKYGTHSALNMFYEYPMTSPDIFEKYVGFTETEVRNLCLKYNKNYDEMKDWYDGYSFPTVLHVYNPRSVVESISRNKYGSYWTRTETYEALKIYIEMDFDGLKDDIIYMIAGESVKINPEKFQNDMTTFKTKDDVLTLLVHLGYLAFNQETSRVYIPNKEIQGEFNNTIEGEYWKDIIRMIQTSEKLLEATWNLDNTTVAALIDNIHMDNTSILTYNDENSLACVISLAYYNTANYYTKIREFPSGYGFADIVYIPKKNIDKPALIIELKNNLSARGAINQIKERKYIESLKEYHGNLLLVGINYDKKTKKHNCLIERFRQP